MDSFQKIKRNVVIITIILFILFGTISLNVLADDVSTISISPANQTHLTGESFSVDVYCIPTQPIKSFEFKLSFDPSYLEVNSVSEGDIFDGYTTFFNSGIIDNTAGTIVNIYNLIIGAGNVSNAGTFVSITFTAKNTAGISSLDLYEVGITDEKGYLSISVVDGSVTIQGTEDPPSPPGGGGGGYVPPPAGDGGDQNQTTEGNNPPETPIKPSGSTFIEMGIDYTYSSTTFDIDGDQIRFQFDWGDNTYSDWSEFVAANTTISMSHSWNNISTYEVRIVAQDENSTNSSWSQSLEVTVSQAGSEDEEPIIDVEVTNNETTNQTIVFDASGSYDLDGAIISYHWDFGDGTTGTGISLAHNYENPGTYTVILTVTDNNGEEYSKTMIVNVGSQATDQSEEKGIPLLYIIVGAIGFASIVLICLLVVFKDFAKSFLSKNDFHSFEHKKMLNDQEKIDRLDTKIEKLKEGLEMTEDCSSKISDDQYMAERYFDSRIESTLDEGKSDMDILREKIDRLLKEDK